MDRSRSASTYPLLYLYFTSKAFLVFRFFSLSFKSELRLLFAFFSSPKILRFLVEVWVVGCGKTTSLIMTTTTMTTTTTTMTMTTMTTTTTSPPTMTTTTTAAAPSKQPRFAIKIYWRAVFSTYETRYSLSLSNTHLHSLSLILLHSLSGFQQKIRFCVSATNLAECLCSLPLSPFLSRSLSSVSTHARTLARKKINTSSLSPLTCQGPLL